MLRTNRSAPALAVLMCSAYFGLLTWATVGVTPMSPDSYHNAIVARNLALGDGYRIDVVQYHAGTFKSVVHVPEMHGILQPLLLAGLFWAFGPDEALARIPGFLFVAAAGLLAFFFARRLFGTGAGLLACALVLSDTGLSQWALFGVDDAGFACIYLAAMMAAESALANGRWRTLAGAGLVGGIAILQKTTGIILPLVYVAAALGSGRGAAAFLRRWAVLTIPLAPFAAVYALRNYIGHGSISFRWGAMDWIFKSGGIGAWARLHDGAPELLPTLEAIGWPRVAEIVLHQLRWFFLGLLSLDPFWTATPFQLTSPGLLAPLGLLGLAVHWRSQSRFVTLLLLTMAASVLLVCVFWHTEPRFMSMLSPLFAISIAGLAARAASWAGLRRWATPMLAAVALAWFAVGTTHASSVVRWPPSPFALRECADWIARNTAPGSVILSSGAARFSWVANRPTVSIPAGPVEDTAEVARRYQAEWLVLPSPFGRPSGYWPTDGALTDPESALSPERTFSDARCSVHRIHPAPR